MLLLLSYYNVIKMVKIKPPAEIYRQLDEIGRIVSNPDVTGDVLLRKSLELRLLRTYFEENAVNYALEFPDAQEIMAYRFREARVLVAKCVVGKLHHTQQQRERRTACGYPR